jgi:hypothetical protein
VARTLQVTERTVYAWFSGKTAVPYAAYKLLRILNRFELPGWPGWHMHSGKLWTPEGFGFEPQDAAWWSLLVRQARSFRTLYRRTSSHSEPPEVPGAARLREPALAGSGRRGEPGPSGSPEGRREAPALNLLIPHFGTRGEDFGVVPRSVATYSIANGSHHEKE